MSEKAEKVVYHFLGGICGVATGLVIDAIFPNLNPISQSEIILISALLGVLISSLIHQHNREKVFDHVKKVRDETVALITHEMRTELTSTSWAIEVILETYGDQLQNEHKKMLQDVLKSINTTVMHTVNLLDISLLDIGKLTISLSWTKLEEVKKILGEVIMHYEMGAKRNNIDLVSSLKLDPERLVEVDMLRLRIIVENLLENAMQYTIRDERKIEVKIENDQKYLHIKVSDTGIGIPLEEQAKIFSGFFRASNARKVLSTGSGIGLHMCYEYVKAHHGSIDFSSKENEGTTFDIKIPLKSSANVRDFLDKI